MTSCRLGLTFSLAATLQACTIEAHYVLPDAPADADADADAAAVGMPFARALASAADEWGTAVAVGDGIIVSGLLNAEEIEVGGDAVSGRAFVAKYDGSGSHVWSLGLPAVVRGLAVDSFGGVYATGGFSVPVMLGDVTLTPVGGLSLFVTKLDGATGQFLWSRGYGTGVEEGDRVAVLPDDDIVVCGTFRSTTSLGGAPLIFNGAPNTSQVFVTRLSRANGAHIWSRDFGGTNNDTCAGLATTSEGHAIVAGAFFLNFQFAGGSYAGAGGFDIYVADFDSSGTPIWHQRYGGASPDLANDIAVSPQGDIVIGGVFSDDFTFGAIPLNNAAGQDAFVARLSSRDGSALWAKPVNGSASESGDAVTVVGEEVVLSGVYTGSAISGSLPIPAPETGNSLYVAKFRYADGEPTGARRLGGSNLRGRMTAMQDTIVLTGGFRGAADFGVGILDSLADSQDMYVVRVRP